MTEPANTADKAPVNLASRRYNRVDFDVASLNDQIKELVNASEGLESDIEVWEQSIRNARKQIAKNAKMADKLRAKRQIVAKAAFDVAAEDQP